MDQKVINMHVWLVFALVRYVTVLLFSFHSMLSYKFFKLNAKFKHKAHLQMFHMSHMLARAFFIKPQIRNKLSELDNTTMSRSTKPALHAQKPKVKSKNQ